MPIVSEAATDLAQIAYNERGEVTNFVCGSLHVSWEYDQMGNRIRSMKPSVTNCYEVNALNQYTTISNNLGGSVTFEYDSDGNLTRDHRWRYTWDGENRLTATWPSGFRQEAIFVYNSYDYLHRRVKKEVNLLVDYDSSQPSSPTNGRLVILYTSVFVYDQNKIILEQTNYADGSRAITHYVWGLDLADTLDGSGGVGGLMSVRTANGTYFPCYDANGNITEYVDTNDVIVAQYRYDPFGETIYAAGNLKDDFHFRFSTKYLDDETFLYNYGRRFYDPWLGRWLSRDPIGIKGDLNEIGFVNNDPVNMIDVAGLMATPSPPNTLSKEMNEVQNALDRATANAAPIFRETTGFDTMMWRIGGALNSLKVISSEQDKDAQYSGNKIYWPRNQDPSVQEINAIHELTHAYRAQEGYWLRAHISREEGIAYAVSYPYYRGAQRFKGLEQRLSQASISTQRNALQNDWKFGWEDLNYMNHTKTMAYALGLLPRTIDLSASDWQNMERSLGVDVSCKKLANSYNKILKSKGSCLKFKCLKDSASDYDITTGVEIPRGQE